MIARLCLSAIAAGLLLCGPSAAQSPTSTPSGSPSGQSAPVAGGNQGQAADDKKGATPGVPVLDAAKPPQDQDGGRNHANAQDGVGAGEHQQANNEDKLVNLTFWLVIATLFLMAATIGLWWETRKLAAQAKEASKDTKRLIEIAERAAAETARAAQAAVDAISAERAWVTPGVIVKRLEENLTDSAGNNLGVSCGLAVKWVNSGRTPALQLGISTTFLVRPFNEPPPDLSDPIPVASGGAILGPGSDAISSFIWISGDEFTAFERRETRVLLMSRVEYSTTTHPKETFRTYACFDVIYLETEPDFTGRLSPKLEIALVAGVPMMS